MVFQRKMICNNLYCRTIAQDKFVPPLDEDSGFKMVTTDTQGLQPALCTSAESHFILPGQVVKTKRGEKRKRKSKNSRRVNILDGKGRNKKGEGKEEDQTVEEEDQTAEEEDQTAEEEGSETIGQILQNAIEEEKSLAEYGQNVSKDYVTNRGGLMKKVARENLGVAASIAIAVLSRNNEDGKVNIIDEDVDEGDDDEGKEEDDEDDEEDGEEGYADSSDDGFNDGDNEGPNSDDEDVDEGDGHDRGNSGSDDDMPSDDN
jgi:hypothetical protein